MLRYLLLAIALWRCTLGQRQDQTTVPGTGGPEVVSSVISLIRQSCVFPDDRQMLRRFAYLVSNDGTNPNTYQAGNNGGIWQVSLQDFQRTQNDPTLTKYYVEINTKFAINWNSVTWNDLRKPLYSGLAAELYLVQEFHGNVPTKVETQAAWYQKTFVPNDLTAAYTYTTMSQKLDNLVTACGNANLDLAFLMDTSSSLNPNDFIEAKDFASDVLGPFNVDANAVRVAFLTFATGFSTVFRFNQFSTKADVQSAIKAALYRPGETDTDAALQYAAATLFTPSGGSRASSAKVAIIVTDGKADHHANAISRAKDLKDMGVTIFVIGVGNTVNIDELNQLASDPPCSHVQLLSNYADLGSLRSQIQQLSCKAPVVLQAGNYSFQCQTTSYYRVYINSSETITIQPDRGSVDIYGSFLNPNPNAAFSEFKATATATGPVIVYVNGENRPLFLSIVSQGGNPQYCPAGNRYNVLVHNSHALLLPTAKKICYIGGIVRECTPLDYLSTIYRVVKDPNQNAFCQMRQAGLFPFPNNDFSRFIYCDANHQAYVVYCPVNFWYRDYSKMCVPGQPPVVTNKPIVYTTPIPVIPVTPQSGNPCTGTVQFFAYPPDIHKYIECTEWPNFGVIKDCFEHHRWSDSQKLCIYDASVDPNGPNYLNTPIPASFCKEGLQDNDLYYHPFPGNRTKYIQCDQFGDAFVKECPIRRQWNQQLLTCVPDFGLINENQLPTPSVVG